jgi:DnaJ-class molecular chaperone
VVPPFTIEEKMNKKERTFTFKADESLAVSLDRIANKSEFIRQAVQTALAEKCPLCNGAGALSQQQQNHLEHFLTLHSLERCNECNAVHFVCHPPGEADTH